MLIGFQRIIKYFIDVILALLVFILFSPFGLIIAILIKITSEGPIFFIQERPGIHKKIFKIYKFRTMRLGSEIMIKDKEVMTDDDRVTSIGKFLRRYKLDEMPQVLNVLKGEMSLIGPRPERIASLDDYDDEISRRLLMRPGMTGLAQVSGNIYLNLSDRYKYDVYYVDHFSLLLDLKIILRTIGVIICGEGKYVDKSLVKLDVKKSRKVFVENIPESLSIQIIEAAAAKEETMREM